MSIELSNLVPHPIKEIPHKESEIWEKESVIFNKSEFYYIHAPSGRGKTSLLSTLYGIRDDFDGELFIEERNVNLFNAFDWSVLRKKTLSYIFQGLELFDDLSALDNIQLKNSQNHFKTEAEIRNIARQIEIESFLKNKCGILSFGQRQRVAIIRALCQPMEFLLADEPFSHLDSKASQIAFTIISTELNNQKAGLIFTGLKTESEFDITKRLRL